MFHQLYIPTSRLLHQSSEYLGPGNSTQNNQQIEQNFKNLFRVTGELTKQYDIMGAKILENKETQRMAPGQLFSLGHMLILKEGADRLET